MSFSLRVEQSPLPYLRYGIWKLSKVLVFTLPRTKLTAATGAVERNIIFMMTPTMFGLAAGILTVIAGLSSLPRISE